MKNMIEKLKAFLATLKDRFLILSLPVRIGVGVLVVALSLSLISGLLRSFSRAVAGHPKVTVTQAPAPVQATAPSQASAGQPQPASPAVPTQPAASAPAGPTPIIAGQTPSTAASQSMTPAYPLETAMIANQLDRTLQIDDGRGPADFLHEQVQKFGLASDSSHNNGMPKYNSFLITHIAGYVKIDQPGNYSFAANSRGGASNEVHILVNDADLGSGTGFDSNNGSYAAYALTKPISMTPGWYKVEALVRQNYQTVAPVSVSVTIKGTGAMHDVSPSLVNPVQPPPTAPPAPVVATPAATQTTAAPVTAPAATPAKPAGK